MKIVPPFNLISNSKDFSEPLLGSPALNRAGLHVARVRTAAACVELRRRLAVRKTRDEEVRKLDNDGCVAIGNFLPAAQFARLSDEVEAAISSSEKNHPLPRRNDGGFGSKQAFSGGFDRFDGGTLNRFLHIDSTTLPESAAAARSGRFSDFSRAILGMPMPASKISIYLTVQGDEEENPDDQRVFHRDTFFSCVKFWYFLRDVKSDDGPFVYVPGSHRFTPERLQWEKEKSILSSEDSRKHGGGSFRIDPSLFGQLGLREPISFPVQANTLVLADTVGFHRRGDARPWSQRLALFGQYRPYAFSCVGW